MDRLASVYFGKEDDLHVRELRHELHKHAELEFDLPETKAIVEGELDRLKIPYTEKYAPCSVVAYLNYGADAEAAPPVNAAGHVFTLAFRADMDALPITEKSGVPFASGHKNGHGEADTAQASRTYKMSPTHVRRHFRPPECQHPPRQQHDTDGFAQQQSEHNAQSVRFHQIEKHFAPQDNRRVG